ncbi:vWA domain-containing protein [Desulfotalea psychrophila]|nr:VWA domain-containing protein [Desulfotalea psychrophila]
MRFVHPEFLWLLLLLPLLAFFRGKQGPGPALIFSSTALIGQLSSVRKNYRGKIALFLRLLTLALIICALARPQLGNTTREIKSSGIDILLAVDVSGSMQAMDFTLNGKRTNRLEVVKDVMAKFISQRPNDSIGLVAFAGRPYVVCPPTLDHNWLTLRLHSLSIGMIEDGTAIGSAIGTGVNRLREKKSPSQIIILLTDGINNAGKVPPLIAAEAAKSFKVKVYTIGAGTRGEAPIPITDAFGRRQLVRARVDIDDKTLSKVAQITGARYFRATDTESLEKVYAEINSMETTSRSMKKFENYQELFPFLIMFSLILLCFEISNKRRLP